MAAKERDAEVRLGVMVPKSGPYQTVSNLKLSGDGSYVTEPHAQVDVIQFTGRDRGHQTNETINQLRGEAPARESAVERARHPYATAAAARD